MKIVIIGGVAGGASAAARLRRLHEQADIVMLERGAYISYANCGLPYYVGGAITDREELTLQTPESFHGRFRVDVRVLSEAVAIDPAGKTVTVKNLQDGSLYQEPYDALILSPGAEPVVPPIPGAKDARVFALRTIPDTLRIRDFIEGKKPRKAVVVGGGAIGMEMAENLHEAGLDVTVVELADHVIAPLDADMAADVHGYARKKGIRLLLGTAVKAIVPQGDGLSVQAGDESLPADMVLMSVGVRPESGLARAAGLEVSPRGAIVTDEHMRTSDPCIYAVGDAVQVTHFVSGQPAFLPLAGPANKQGRIAADNICGIPSIFKGSQGALVLKLFDMTVAATGLNESALKAADIAYDKVYAYGNSHASYYPGATSQTIKLLFSPKDGRVLGAQIVGFEGVDKRCDVINTAIRAGMTVYDLAELELCYAPPFSSAKDPVNMAGFMAENLLTGKVKQFHWHDVDNLPRDGSVTILDVRTSSERRRGKIDGSLHIPVDELRERLSELNKAKPVYVHCHSGLRSYIACRILTQNGFDAYNLAGGYRLYACVKEANAPEKEKSLPCGAPLQAKA